MASVQELLLAAQTKKSPFISLLEGVAGGVGQAQNQALERTKVMIQMEDQRQERERAAENDKLLKQMISGSQEQQTKTSFSGVSPDRKPTQPGLRLTGAAIGKHGYLEPKFDVMQPKSFQAKEYMDAKGQARIGNYDSVTGQLIQSPTDPFASGRERSTASGDLRKEFIDRPEVKEFVNISTQVKSMDALLNSAMAGDQKNQLALDQGLITMYNKLLDPNSVVRESEYARTPENLPMLNRIEGAIIKVQAGGAGLTNADREALVLGAKIIANERGKVFSERRRDYGKLAVKSGADPDVVTGTIADFVPYTFGNKTNVEQPRGGQKIGRFSVEVR